MSWIDDQHGLQKPLVGPQRHMAVDVTRRWSQQSAGKASGHKGRTLVTMQAKAKGKKKDSDDSKFCMGNHVHRKCHSSVI